MKINRTFLASIFLIFISFYVKAQDIKPNTSILTKNTNLIALACIGDSNTQGSKNRGDYPSSLQKQLGDTYKVRNFGKGGATIIDGTLFPYHKTPQYKEALKFTPDIVLMMFGTNDANPKWCKDPNRITDFKGTPQEEFKSRYLKLIQDFKNLNPKVEIYILSPLPIWPEKRPAKKHHGRKEQLHEWVIPTISEIIKETNIHFIDVQNLMKEMYPYTTDGVHFNKEGYEILASKIAEKIN